jgi:sulfotransferase family protein
VAIRVGKYEVLSVTPMEDVPGLRGFEVELPEAGRDDDVYVVPISGWLVGLESRAVAIEVVYHDRVLRTVPLQGRRPELLHVYPDLTEDTETLFQTLVGLVGLKLESELLLQAVLENGDRAPFASMVVRRQPLQSHFEPAIDPLILTGLGRSGTTWLMKMFASHPEIVVFRRFPYEHSVAKYWMHMLRVLTEPASPEDSADPDTLQGDLHWVGHNPFHDVTVFERPELAGWLGRDYVEQLATFCQSAIEAWYARVARSQDQRAPAYFAEKMGPTYLPLLTRELYPKSKEVVLVRDFRDVACSMREFDAGRTYSQFDPLNRGSANPEIPAPLETEVFAMRNTWRTRRDHAHLVRYEDMVMRPNETLATLLEYVEVDSSPQTVEELLSQASRDLPDLPGATGDPALVETHRTIPDPQDTIGRWRHNGGDSREDLYWDAFGEVLEEFGYTKSGSFE